MPSWFPQSPTAAGPSNPAAEKTVRGGSSGDRNEPPSSPHDRILGNLFEVKNSPQDRWTGLPRAPLLDNSCVYDPFDGSVLGTLVAPDPNVQPEEHGTFPKRGSEGNEELWTHLSRVLELQNTISCLHLDMEGIGSNANGTRSRATSVTRVVIDDVEGDEGIGGQHDEEAERNKAREEQFLNLAGQFHGKKEAIDGIMRELDSLSKAVTEFHALQAPKIDFPSTRNNSLSATNTAAEPNPAFRDVRSPASPTSSQPPPPPPVLKLADEPRLSPELVDSPISTLISLPP